MKVYKKCIAGGSLIEVMVALFVLAIGLLGVLAMQTRSVQLNQNAYLYSQAVFLVGDMVEAIRTTRSSLGNYAIGYDEDAPSSPGCSTQGASCSSAQIVNWNVAQWRSNVESLLPGGQGEIVEDEGQFIIKVRFQIGINESDGSAITDEISIRTGV